MGYIRSVAALGVVAFGILMGLIANKGTEAPSVQEYYTSLESRLGYSLLLGNARHCGYWKSGTTWPFAIGKAQREMEHKLYKRFGLSNESLVLDAGAGSAVVASYMAEHGLTVQGVDLTPLHVASAQRTIQKRGLQSKVTVQQGEYHDLPNFKSSTFDGVYTMETFVHADDPLKVLKNFLHLLKPGGVLVMNEADLHWDSKVLQEVLRLSHCQNTLKEGTYEELLKQAGLVNITIEDYTDNVLQLWRLSGVIGAVPYDIMKLSGLHTRFTNMMAGVEAYSLGPRTIYLCEGIQALRCYTGRFGRESSRM